MANPLSVAQARDRARNAAVDYATGNATFSEMESAFDDLLSAATAEAQQGQQEQRRKDFEAGYRAGKKSDCYSDTAWRAYLASEAPQEK